jgi:hypothetical protein
MKKMSGEKLVEVIVASLDRTAARFEDKVGAENGNSGPSRILSSQGEPASRPGGAGKKSSAALAARGRRR